MTASSEVVGPGDRTTYTLMVTNTGSVDLTGVSVGVQLPDHINTFGVPPGFDCGSSLCQTNEAVTWSVGTLGPGQSQGVFYRVRTIDDAPPGTITSTATASTTGAADASTSLDIEIDNSPLVRLNLASDPGPVVAGEAFTYTLTFGNTGTSSPSNVVLTLPVPDGASFVSATGGGNEGGGTVTWNLGTLGVGASGQVQMTVLPDASLGDGQVLEATAELDPNTAAEPVARSSAVTPVRDDVPLRLEYAVSQTAVEPDGQLTYTLTATNTSAADLTEVQARVLLPGFIQTFGVPPGFDCGSSLCQTNEAVTWSVGTLGPGQSQSVTFEPTVRSNAPRGEALRSLVVATATGSNEVVLERDALVGEDTPLPVELVAFTAALDGEAVLLQWQTASETNNVGFEVQHRRTGEGTASEGAWQELAFLASKAPGGTSTEALSYAHRAAGLPYGRHLFRLQQVDIDGTERLSEERAVEITLAEAFALSAPAPNPFRRSATFTLAVRETQEVQARVYDVLGRRVAVLHEGPMAAGQAHRLRLEAGRLASGLYLVRITGERFAPQTRRVVLVR